MLSLRVTTVNLQGIADLIGYDLPPRPFAPRDFYSRDPRKNFFLLLRALLSKLKYSKILLLHSTLSKYWNSVEYKGFYKESNCMNTI